MDLQMVTTRPAGRKSGKLVTWWMEKVRQKFWWDLPENISFILKELSAAVLLESITWYLSLPPSPSSHTQSTNFMHIIAMECNLLTKGTIFFREFRKLQNLWHLYKDIVKSLELCILIVPAEPRWECDILGEIYCLPFFPQNEIYLSYFFFFNILGWLLCLPLTKRE